MAFEPESGPAASEMPQLPETSLYCSVSSVWPGMRDRLESNTSLDPLVGAHRELL